MEVTFNIEDRATVHIHEVDKEEIDQVFPSVEWEYLPSCMCGKLFLRDITFKFFT
jgi:hypothetical protein